jgi:hypothetical protein
MSREIMQQALTVLKAWDALIKYQYGGSSEAMTAMQIVAWRTVDTIEELETALAQPEHPLDKKADNARELGLDYETERDHGFDRTASHMAGEYVFTNQQNVNTFEERVQKSDKSIRKMQRLGQELEQEPAAWLCENAVGHKYFRWKKPTSHYKPIPLYTAPTKQWVGLTDEEISEVLGSDIYQEHSGELKFIRAIEAKLREKNT